MATINGENGQFCVTIAPVTRTAAILTCRKPALRQGGSYLTTLAGPKCDKEDELPCKRPRLCGISKHGQVTSGKVDIKLESS